MTSGKKIFIIAGPKGAGKTTFAREYLPKEAECPDFINVDLIAAGLSPFDPKKNIADKPTVAKPTFKSRRSPNRCMTS